MAVLFFNFPATFDKDFIWLGGALGAGSLASDRLLY